MASIKKLKPGMDVYSIRRVKMGNTTLSYNALYTVRIVEVDPEGEWVRASWNSNKVEKYYKNEFSKWKINKPLPKKQVWGTDSY